ncbi:MAG TPA: hypothetical protein PLM20_09410 [Syntrophomonadaceae bacterium]|nr:hypothetical protein [Syntrophomonadaceae bacterium]
MKNIRQRIIQLYEQIEKLALQQVKLVESKQSIEEILGPLDELINQRQECMNQLDELLSGLSTEQKTALAEEENTEDILKRILSLDSQSQKRLKEILEATSSKLIKMQDMKKASRAYGGQDEPTEAWFFDRKR